MISCPILFFLFDDFDYMVLIIISIANAFVRLKNFIDVYRVLNKYFFFKLSKDKKETTVPDNGSSRTFLACLFVICLDNILFIFYVFPLSYGVYISKLQGGTLALVNWILICYLCDTGGLVIGRICGRVNFGAPITPTKTREGIYGGFMFGYQFIYLDFYPHL
jgi:CDP-diglyceride synthetase